MIRRIGLTLAVMALLPISVEAQRPEAATQRMEAAMARAAQAGIPRSLFESRIAEGRAKGVSEDRIAEAVERRAAGLARAQEALARAGERTTSAELSAGADALEAGVPGQALRSVIEAARAEDRPVALAVLGELVRQGMPVEKALERVTAALEQRGDALSRLPQQAAAERRGRPDGVGRPAGVGGRPDNVGGRPSGAGKPESLPTAGPPAGIPAAGKPAGLPGGKPNPRP